MNFYADGGCLHGVFLYDALGKKGKQQKRRIVSAAILRGIKNFAGRDIRMAARDRMRPSQHRRR